jgi:hypothetical protein
LFPVRILEYFFPEAACDYRGIGLRDVPDRESRRGDVPQPRPFPAETCRGRPPANIAPVVPGRN